MIRGFQLLVSLLAILPHLVLAQSFQARSALLPNRTYSTVEEALQPITLSPPAFIEMAMWEVMYYHNLSDTLSPGQNLGLAAIIFNGTEYWVSEWNTASFHRLAADGSWLESFVIPNPAGGNLSNVRGIAWDDSLYYMSNNTQTIFVVDPLGQTVVQTITAPDLVRAFCYTPEADSGRGGFWISNWGPPGVADGPMTLIDRSGNVLRQITPSDHRLSGTYGLSYDGTSPGGPYLWAFDQSGSGAMIRQIDLATGRPTVYERDVNDELGLSGAAGGMFIAENHPLYPGIRILGGLLQESMDISFGYELDFQFAQVDARLLQFHPQPQWSQVPLVHARDITFEAEMVNLGTQNIQTVNGTLIIENQQQEVHRETVSETDLPGEMPRFLSLGSWSAQDTGLHHLTLSLDTGTQIDEEPDNNQLQVPILVNDSVFARDVGIPNSGIGIGAGPGQGGIIGHNITLRETDFMTSVSFQLYRPKQGDQVYATVYSVSQTGRPENPLANTATYTLTQTDADSGVFLTLPFPNGPLGLPSGTYFVGINETNQNISLAITEQNFSPGKNWIYWNTIPTGNWANSEMFGYEVSLVIRPNLGPCAPVYLRGNILTEQQDTGTGNGVLKVQLSGGKAPFSYQWDDPLGQTQATADHLSGGSAYTVAVVDANGCSLTLRSDTLSILNPIENSLTAGIQFYQLYPNPSRERVNLQLAFATPTRLQLKLYSAAGQLFFFSSSEVARLHYQETIDLTKCPRGVYFLHISTPDGQWGERIVVE